MKFRLIFIVISFLFFSLIIQCSADNSDYWDAVDQAQSKGLFQSAISNLNHIITDAQKRDAWPELTRAICKRAYFQAQIMGGGPEHLIKAIDPLLKTLPKQTHPILHALLGHWYWQYFDQNRWRFFNRTYLADEDESDFTSWSLRRIYNEIDNQFQKALSFSHMLRQIPVAEYDKFLTKGTMDDIYRPTLFDLICHDVLKFYTIKNQYSAVFEDPFEIPSDSPVFENLEKFLQWNPQPLETNSLNFKALKLYQELLKYHLQGTNINALALNDFERLKWAWSVSYGDSKRIRYIQALQTFIDRWPSLEASAFAMMELASLYKDENDLVKAKHWAIQVDKRFSSSVCGIQARNLIKEIDSPFVRVEIENIWNYPWPDIKITYKNVTNLFVKIVPSTRDELIDHFIKRWGILTDEIKRDLISRHPVKSWMVSLEPTTNYLTRSYSAKISDALKPGYYSILVGCDPGFSETNAPVFYGDFQVSSMACILYGDLDDLNKGLVVNSETGQPLGDVEINIFWTSGHSENFRIVKTNKVITARDGSFCVKHDEKLNNRILLVKNGDSELLIMDASHSFGRNGVPGSEFNKVVLFTDRAIYRPGQAVYYKGILVRADQNNDTYKTIPRGEVDIVFKDPGGKEIGKVHHVSNEFGSFSGVFHIPASSLTGTYWIQARNGFGNVFINVEEYKRPKFTVEFETNKVQAVLNEPVRLSGKAVYLNGAAVTRARYNWRVLRRPRFVNLTRLIIPPMQYEKQIAFGEGITASDGSFSINFIPKADPDIKETSDIFFNFEVILNVSDQAGETQSKIFNFHVGFVSLQIDVAINNPIIKSRPAELKIKTLSYDGFGLNGSGKIKVYHLIAPTSVERPPLWTGTGIWSDVLDVRGSVNNYCNLTNWPAGDLVLEKDWVTDQSGLTNVSIALETGVYKLSVEAKDRNGKSVSKDVHIIVIDPQQDKFIFPIPNFSGCSHNTARPGSTVTLYWGTGYTSGVAFVELVSKGEVLKRFWTNPEKTLHTIDVEVTEKMRGGFNVKIVFVRENRLYFNAYYVAVPWDNKLLNLRWERFRSKLEPGENESWIIKVSLPSKDSLPGEKEKEENLQQPEKVEMVATLYDAALDLFSRNDWTNKFDFFRQDFNSGMNYFSNRRLFLNCLHDWIVQYESYEISWRRFPDELVANSMRILPFRGGANAVLAAAPMLAEKVGSTETKGIDREGSVVKNETGTQDSVYHIQSKQFIKERSNFNETAFFFPHLTSDSNGLININFKMPDTYTSWRFLGFVHDNLCRNGLLTENIVTTKELMIIPNPPRFLRQGDVGVFNVRVLNQSDSTLTGEATLSFTGLIDNQNYDMELGLSKNQLKFRILPGESETLSWSFHINKQVSFLKYHVSASTQWFSDAEEGVIPVLSDKIPLIESCPIYVNGPGTNKFQFKNLIKTDRRDFRKNNAQLIVQVTARPIWYAIMALPVILDEEYECTDNIFNKYYANCVAKIIRRSNPDISDIVKLWQQNDALKSPLVNNSDLKTANLENTPWYDDAIDDTNRRKNLAVLFDENRIDDEISRSLVKLVKLQKDDGRWPWFSDGPANDQITTYIISGFGRLKKMGVAVPINLLTKSISTLDEKLFQQFSRITKTNYVISISDVDYLYARSFYLDTKEIDQRHRDAFEFYLSQCRTNWNKLTTLQAQAQCAVLLKRWGGESNYNVSQDIIKSLIERSQQTDELGMFWEYNRYDSWYGTLIETQTSIIEALDEVTGDFKFIEKCKLWLLRQKQTMAWNTHRSTSDAIYALLMRGDKILSDLEMPKVKLGNIRPMVLNSSNLKDFHSEQSTPGFYEVRFLEKEIKPDYGFVTIWKTNKGLSWGCLYLKHFENINEIKQDSTSAIKLKKTVFKKETTKNGQILRRIGDSVAVGDEIVVKFEIISDRDFDYVHLKDLRASGTEPVDVISRYKSQDGLWYYHSTRDTHTSFFIEHLPKGLFTLEYSLRAQTTGKYNTGLATIECMYAPEFRGHSKNIVLTVK